MERCSIPGGATLLIAMLIVTATQAEPAKVTCTNPLIVVAAKDTSIARRVCNVAAKAQARFQALGLIHDKPISVSVTNALDVAPGHCVALYDTATGTLQVLPIECLANAPGRLGAFPELPAKIAFDGLIVHELAHAYIDQTTNGRAVSRLAHEYLAYALQLEALPKADREGILTAANVSLPVALDDLNEAVLGFAPATFAAMAWLHFSALPDPADFVQDIVNGKVVFTSLRE